MKIELTKEEWELLKWLLPSLSQEWFMKWPSYITLCDCMDILHKKLGEEWKESTKNCCEMNDEDWIDSDEEWKDE